jgi:DNA repair protein RecN (Recombination protein N)
LDALDPQPGEEAELDEKRRLMKAGVQLRGDIARARDAVGENGAERACLDALRWLEGAAEGTEGRLDGAVAALERALNDLAEVQAGIDECLDALDTDPMALEATEDRLFALRALARKHGVMADDLGGFADSLRERLAAVDAGDAGIQDLAKAEDAARHTFDTACAALTGKRQVAAEALDRAMATELAPLKMERAVFQTVLAPVDPGPEGAETVTFEVATNPGAPAGALNRIASGGELSRFLLALKVCLHRAESGVTLIFDEIDRGVGGATADAVGRRLRDLAEGAQVLVVTHSPQVAALGAHHWHVAKHVEGGQTLSQVTQLSADARIDEIARMLSGDTITDAARGAARALIGA